MRRFGRSRFRVRFATRSSFHVDPQDLTANPGRYGWLLRRTDKLCVAVDERAPRVRWCPRRRSWVAFLVLSDGAYVDLAYAEHRRLIVRYGQKAATALALPFDDQTIGARPDAAQRGQAQAAPGPEAARPAEHDDMGNGPQAQA